MKFKADKNVLFEAVTSASKACAAKSSITALEGVLFSLKGNNLTVSGYDLEMGITTVVPVNGLEDGEIVLNAKIVSEMIRKMPSGREMEFITKDETQLTIRSRQFEFSTTGLSGNEYPNIPDINRDNSFLIKESVLRSMIAQTLYATAQVDIKPVHMGSKFYLSDETLDVVSVDGVRLARRTEKIVAKDFDFVVPAKTLSELIRVLNPEAEDSFVEVSIDRNQICFSRKDYRILSRLLEGTFLDYAKTMDFKETSTAVVKAKDFIDALDRTLLLISDRFKNPVICTLENDTLKVFCQTNLGTVNELIPIKYDGERLEIAFNARYMMDALKYSECDEVRLQFVNSLKPIRVLPLGDNSYSALVLPVRIKQ